MFTPPLPPGLLIRTAQPAHHGLPPRPARSIPRAGAAAPGAHDLLPVHFDREPAHGTAGPVVVPAPVPPLRWRIWLGRRLIRLGQRLAGDSRPGDLRLVTGAD